MATIKQFTDALEKIGWCDITHLLYSLKTKGCGANVGMVACM